VDMSALTSFVWTQALTQRIVSLTVASQEKLPMDGKGANRSYATPDTRKCEIREG
jgi:hypothetical protein